MESIGFVGTSIAENGFCGDMGEDIFSSWQRLVKLPQKRVCWGYGNVHAQLFVCLNCRSHFQCQEVDASFSQV